MEVVSEYSLDSVQTEAKDLVSHIGKAGTVFKVLLGGVALMSGLTFVDLVINYKTYTQIAFIVNATGALIACSIAIYLLYIFW